MKLSNEIEAEQHMKTTINSTSANFETKTVTEDLNLRFENSKFEN